MPMDGFTLSYMRRELLSALRGGRVDKVNQPERDALVLLIRSGGGNHRLLLSANANQARAQLTAQAYENPAEPPDVLHAHAQAPFGRAREGCRAGSRRPHFDHRF